ncbi:MAG: hypothetical protein BJ554DRAFT_670, partial [Olpidium bornovanus]
MAEGERRPGWSSFPADHEQQQKHYQHPQHQEQHRDPAESDAGRQRRISFQQLQQLFAGNGVPQGQLFAGGGVPQGQPLPPPAPSPHHGAQPPASLAALLAEPPSGPPPATARNPFAFSAASQPPPSLSSSPSAASPLAGWVTFGGEDEAKPRPTALRESFGGDGSTVGGVSSNPFLNAAGLRTTADQFSPNGAAARGSGSPPERGAPVERPRPPTAGSPCQLGAEGATRQRARTCTSTSGVVFAARSLSPGRSAFLNGLPTVDTSGNPRGGGGSSTQSSPGGFGFRERGVGGGGSGSTSPLSGADPARTLRTRGRSVSGLAQQFGAASLSSLPTLPSGSSTRAGEPPVARSKPMLAPPPVAPKPAAVPGQHSRTHTPMDQVSSFGSPSPSTELTIPLGRAAPVEKRTRPLSRPLPTLLSAKGGDSSLDGSAPVNVGASPTTTTEWENPFADGEAREDTDSLDDADDDDIRDLGYDSDDLEEGRGQRSGVADNNPFADAYGAEDSLLFRSSSGVASRYKHAPPSYRGPRTPATPAQASRQASAAPADLRPAGRRIRADVRAAKSTATTAAPVGGAFRARERFCSASGRREASASSEAGLAGACPAGGRRGRGGGASAAAPAAERELGGIRRGPARCARVGPVTRRAGPGRGLRRLAAERPRLDPRGRRGGVRDRRSRSRRTVEQPVGAVPLLPRTTAQRTRALLRGVWGQRLHVPAEHARVVAGQRGERPHDIARRPPRHGHGVPAREGRRRRGPVPVGRPVGRADLGPRHVYRGDPREEGHGARLRRHPHPPSAADGGPVDAGRERDPPDVAARLAAAGRLRRVPAGEAAVEVYTPLDETRSVLAARVDVGAAAGGVNALAPLPLDPSRVFSGHDCGKIVAWGAESRAMLFVVNASVYRITAMVGVGDRYLWTGFQTGKIYVYDTRPAASAAPLSGGGGCG